MYKNISYYYYYYATSCPTLPSSREGREKYIHTVVEYIYSKSYVIVGIYVFHTLPRLA